MLSKYLILAFLFVLPLFGNRPGSAQAVAFTLVVLMMTIAALPIAWQLISKRTSACSGNIVIVTAALYCIVSFFSLFPIPVLELVGFLKSQLTNILDIYAVFDLTKRLILAREDDLLYVFYSLLMTVAGFIFFLAIYSHAKEDKNFSLRCCLAIFSSLVVSLGAGLLDYYGLIDLRFLRALDPVVNPGDIQFRLQSFFGHSGWFAEFVTLTIPFAMVLLLMRGSYLTHIGLLLAVLVMGEFVLILTFQRGGWLSYPLTLIFVWCAVYVSRLIERGELNFLRALRRSLLKVAVSVPITVLVSLALIIALSKLNLIQTQADGLLERYTERFKDISKSSDRADFMRAGFMLGKLHPIFGAGSESFAYQYKKEFRNQDGQFSGTIDLPLHGSAHNVYLQTVAGKGFGGLLALLLLVGIAIFLSVKAVLREDRLPLREKIILLICASSSVAFLIYGNVQEIFYIQPLQFLFFAVLGLGAATLPDKQTVGHFKFSRVMLCTTVFFLAHLVWEYFFFLHPADRKFGLEYGCFSPESDSTGNHYQWCGVRARKAFAFDNSENVVNLRAEAITNSKGPNLLSIAIGEQRLKEVLLDSTKDISVEIPSHLQDRVWLEEGQRKIKLDMALGNFVVPANEIKDSADVRVLAFRIYLAKP